MKLLAEPKEPFTYVTTSYSLNDLWDILGSLSAQEYELACVPFKLNGVWTAALALLPQQPLYYIQNIGFCGNCLYWWREGGHGYTANLDKAWKVTKEKADSICTDRPKEDIPWPVEKVDALASRHLDSEVARSAALKTSL